MKRCASILFLVVTLSFSSLSVYAAKSGCSPLSEQSVDQLGSGGFKVAALRALGEDGQVIEIKKFHKGGVLRLLVAEINGEAERKRYLFKFSGSSPLNYSLSVTRMMYSSPLYVKDSELVAMISTSLVVCDGRLRGVVGGPSVGLKEAFQEGLEVLRHAGLGKGKRIRLPD